MGRNGSPTEFGSIQHYYGDVEIAALLRISFSRRRNKRCAGDPLTPIIQLPGDRTRLWPRKNADDWLAQFTREG